ncbi:hypothetical protein HG536_0A09330 [Torulaspora globosa]|uniref:Thioredoxin domain-containing protein n=1 Tax=Torulaspora globosa TaxID=48254 RepID=A0A7G3ZC80_9SACH|nr:uncharacterized protein HG536_0A09330 [Torulaspora globosa]QLL31116.1 hypothetical protein HG536_0A09330 [Torulaspora globosa]
MAVLLTSTAQQKMFRTAAQPVSFRTYLGASKTFARFKGYSSIPKLTSLADFQSSIKGSKLSVVDFYATWCGPCKAMAPHLSKLVDEYPDVGFYKVDVDESPDVAQHCQVSAMPTFVFAKNGEMLGKIIGANPQGIEQGIKQLQ